jgi:hypothetical protein
MRATEHAPRCPYHLLERRQGLAEIVERGTVVFVECQRVIHRKGAGPGGICDLQKIKKFLEAKKMVPPASIVRRWVPRDHSVNLDEPYIAVHLNLD